MLEKKLIYATLFASGMATALPSIPVTANASGDFSNDVVSLAVYGDAPYGCKAGKPDCVGYHNDTPDGPNPADPRELNATPAFIDAVNNDPKVRLVLHVGDIHSGHQYCYLSYDQAVYNLWTQFKDPLVYTPGDNEWTDCHKSGEGGNQQNSHGDYVDYANGDPVANLALVRSIFFQHPGKTLGERTKNVISQAQHFDPAHPSDAEYVENVMWEQSKILFVTVNIPGGSNNDADPWKIYDPNAASTTQIQEQQQRTDADLRWLDAAFAKASADGDKAVVIAEQADMWDLDGNPSSHIANYDTFITKIADQTAVLDKPVLLINGDSHVYRSDNPMINDSACTTEGGACSDDAFDTHPQLETYVGPLNLTNFHRLVVHGNTFPLEYLRLKVDPNANYAVSDHTFGPFSWERVNP